MRWQLDCIPCFFRQVKTVQRLLGLREEVSRELMRRIARLVASIPDDVSPPEFAIDVYRTISEVTGVMDPYEEIKKESNRIVLELLPILVEKIKRAQDPLKEAVFFSIAGNIIDFGVAQEIDVLAELNRLVREERLTEGHFFQIDLFFQGLFSARKILVIGDNCGEVVLDKMFIEMVKHRWPEKEFVFAVRGGPIINDVTLSESIAIGMNSVAKIVSIGIPAPGAVLHRCSPEFLVEFRSADMVISKGQGNFEALSDVDREVFFLFMAKCDVVSEFVGCKRGSILLLKRP